MKLLGIDISNLVIRHASNPYAGHEDLQGRSVNGPVGALAQIIRLVESEKPTHLLIARDSPRDEGFRREIDNDYKAHRPSADNDLIHQFQVTYRAIERLSWPTMMQATYEADDILASAAKSFSGKTVIVSGDRDLLACVSDSVTVSLLRPGGALYCGPAEACEVFGIEPERICDYKALVGDPSDGIRGVEGIGPKRALTLLSEYGDLDSLLQAIGNGEKIRGLSDKLQEKLILQQDSARKSYQLAQLVEDLEIEFNDLLCPSMPSADTHADILDELGLMSLRKQLEDKKQGKKQEGPLDLNKTFKNLLS
jgi:DNA polymerase-1